MNNTIIAPGQEVQSSHPLLSEKREAAKAYFQEHGYPHTKLEEWKYTSVRKITEPAYQIPARDGAGLPGRDAFSGYPLSGLDAWYMVFVNGWLSTELSVLPPEQKGLMLGSLADPEFQDAVAQELGGVATMSSGFAAMNTAGFRDGAYISLSAGVSLDKPLVLYHLAAGSDQPLLVQPRHIIRLEGNSSLRVIEVFAGKSEQPVLTNHVTEVRAGRNALLDYSKLQLEEGENYHVGITEIEQFENASVDTHVISLRGAFARNNLHFYLREKQCRSIMNGLYLLDGKQFLDNHTLVYHGAPECYSDQLYKGIMNGQSTAVFNGKIFVEKDAQKTNAYQRNVNILLSDEAGINAKPQLEIFADDVRCTHGATSGQLDEEAIFYLRSRGLSEEDARRLLLHAYAEEVIDKLQVEELKAPLLEIASNKFGGND